MRKFYFRFRILLMTLTLGLASDWFIDNMKFIDNSTVIEKSEIKNSAIINLQIIQPRFLKTSDVSYGGKTISIYMVSNGQTIYSGNISSFDGNGMKRRIRQAKKIIGRKNGRYVLEFQDKEKHHFEILQYVADDSYDFIHAPTLELALEFEQTMECKGEY